MSMNQDESREWTIVVRITEYSGLGDHNIWWVRSSLEKLVTQLLEQKMEVEEVIARTGYDIDLMNAIEEFK